MITGIVRIITHGVPIHTILITIIIILITGRIITRTIIILLSAITTILPIVITGMATGATGVQTVRILPAEGLTPIRHLHRVLPGHTTQGVPVRQLQVAV
jgi:hypothetical protein